MSLKRAAIAAALLVSLGAMGAPYAQSQTERVRAQADPADKLFRMVMPDGTVVAADGQTRRFYIRNRFGGTAEATFDQVLAKAEPNPTKRAKLKAAFEAALADPRLTNYSYVDKPKINSGPPPCQPSPKGCPMPDLEQSADGDGGDDDDATNLDGITVYGFAPWGGWAFLSSGGLASGTFYTDHHSKYQNPFEEGTLNARLYQMCWEEDFNDFREDQDEACGDAKLSSAGAIVATVGAVTSCPFTVVSDDLAPLICGGSIVGLVIAVIDTYDNVSQCMAKYPGPENC